MVVWTPLLKDLLALLRLRNDFSKYLDMRIPIQQPILHLFSKSRLTSPKENLARALKYIAVRHTHLLHTSEHVCKDFRIKST